MIEIITRIFTYIIAVATIIGCQQQQRPVVPEPIWDGASEVICINIGQLHSKSGLASMDRTKIEQALNETNPGRGAEMAIVKRLLAAPNTSGFNLDKPAYVAMGEYAIDVNTYNMVASIEVASVTDVDNLLKSLATDEIEATVEVDGNKRIISFTDAPIIAGYDNKRLVVISTESETCNLKDVLLKHMEYSAADMSLFHNSDIAAYANLSKYINELSAPDQEVNNETNEEAIEDVNEELDENPYSKYISNNASLIYTLTFDNGSIIYNTDIKGLSEEATKLFKPANANSLNMLPPSPLAMLNIGANGEAFADLADMAISATMETMGGASNEFNIYKNIALGVVASINGDFMIALSDANGTITEDALGDKQLLFTTANALFTANVTDDYIMQNINTYAGTFLKKSGDKYTIDAFGNKITIAQQDKLFFVGVNNDGSTKRYSAADEEWSNNVIGSYLFAMVDLNKLLRSGFGRAALETLPDNIPNRAEREAFLKVLTAVDRAYLTINGEESNMHGECMIITSNSKKNSLQHIVEIFHELAFN